MALNKFTKDAAAADATDAVVKGTATASFEDEADTGTATNSGALAQAGASAAQVASYSVPPTSNPSPTGTQEAAVVARATALAAEADSIAEAATPAGVEAANKRAVAIHEAQAHALAVAQEKALATLGIKRDIPIRVIQNAIPTSELETLGIGVFPRVVVGLDGFSNEDGDLGKVIGVKVYSWSYLTLVTTGEQDDETANKLVRGSYDGVNLKEGQGSVQGYIDSLKAQGYTKAQKKQYLEVYGMLTYSAADGEIPKDEQQMVQISLPPTSVGQFQRFLIEAGIQAGDAARAASSQGLPEPEQDTVIYARQVKRVKDKKKWGVMLFSKTMPKVDADA